MAGRKLFVGSLPYNVSDDTLKAEFSRYGAVTDVHVKPGCEPSRQWAFVTFASADEALRAKDATDRILQFPGTERPCDVMVAKNQGLFGQDDAGVRSAPPPAAYGMPTQAPPPMVSSAPTKVFVGSLPETISEAELQQEFSRYGQITDCHLNTKPVEMGRQWAFITFASPDQAQSAKVAADRILMFPSADRPCEVTLARNQGMFGKCTLMDGQAPPPAAMAPPAAYAPYGYAPAPVQVAAPAPAQGARKIFVGSLPTTISEAQLRNEFSKYGQVTDVHINNRSCEAGRNWAFLSFATPEQAAYAKDYTDRVLVMPGADKACEVMLAKNQGKFGQEGQQGNGGAPPAAAPPPYYAPVAGPPGVSQPPPPPTPPPQHLTPWRMYKTATGLPYYHNHSTGVTQWECPAEFQVPGQPNPYPAPQPVAVAPQPAAAVAAFPVQQPVRYAPY